VNNITQENLHRTAKYFMDTGRAETPEQALGLLQTFGLYIEVGPEVSTSREHQVALLTLVNVARRTFLGGVHVIHAPNSPLLVPLTKASSVCEAVTLLGGKNVKRRGKDWPVALIGNADLPNNTTPCWRVTWEGWRGGVVPITDGRRLKECGSGGLAPALAAATCAAETFLYHSGDHPMVGRRDSGVSLWSPTSPWLSPDPTEAPIVFLPMRLWLIGLGNLGQACLWLLTCLPYDNRREVDLLLQDDDRIAKSNESTSLLTDSTMISLMKTRALAEWLDGRGFHTTICERRFGKWTRRAPHEPNVALFGVDNSLARAALEEAGFGLVVETGLGAGPQSFRNFSLHAFPSSLTGARLWSSNAASIASDVLKMPAYEPSKHPTLDECGLAQLASRTIGVPFVGLTAACFAIAELLRRLHGGNALELISGSTAALEDIEISATDNRTYEFGHVAAAA
jgi:hypothetical protein